MHEAFRWNAGALVYFRATHEVFRWNTRKNTEGYKAWLQFSMSHRDISWVAHNQIIYATFHRNVSCKNLRYRFNFARTAMLYNVIFRRLLEGKGTILPLRICQKVAGGEFQRALFRYCYLHFLVFYFLLFDELQGMTDLYFFYGYKGKEILYLDQTDILFF